MGFLDKMKKDINKSIDTVKKIKPFWHARYQGGYPGLTNIDIKVMILLKDDHVSVLSDDLFSSSKELFILPYEMIKSASAILDDLTVTAIGKDKNGTLLNVPIRFSHLRSPMGKIDPIAVEDVFAMKADEFIGASFTGLTWANATDGQRSKVIVLNENEMTIFEPISLRDLKKLGDIPYDKMDSITSNKKDLSITILSQNETANSLTTLIKFYDKNTFDKIEVELQQKAVERQGVTI